MLSQPQRDYLKTVATTLQIIVGALAAGVLMFGAFTLFFDLGPQGAAQPGDMFLTYLVVVVALIALTAAIAVPAKIVATARQKIASGKASDLQARLPAPPGPADVGDVAPLAAVYQTRLIVGASILEGAAFFSLTVYVIEGHPLSLVAIAVLLAALLSLFPTRSQLEDWVENQMTVIAQLREMQPHDAR